jgi:hypothetical protein
MFNWSWDAHHLLVLQKIEEKKNTHTHTHTQIYSKNFFLTIFGHLATKKKSSVLV